MTGLRWHELELASVIARCGSAVAASKELSLSQSTVSRRLSSVERRLGVRLFDRQARRLVPTSAGAELIEVASEIEDRVQDVMRSIVGRDERLSGVVRVTGLTPILRLVLPRLKALCDDHPRLDLELDCCTDLANLHRQEADIAVRVTSAPPATLIGRRVARIAYALYRRRDEPCSGVVGFPAPRGDIADRDWLEQCVAMPKVRVRVVQDELHRDAIHAGLGAAQLMCAEGDADPELERVPGAPLEWGESLWVLVHPDLRGVARVRTVFDAVVVGLAALRSSFEGEHGAND